MIRNLTLRRFIVTLLLLAGPLTQFQTLYACELMGDGKPKTVCCCDEPGGTGVMGCEIWVKVAAPGDPPPTGESDLSFVALDTASPYTVEYDGADGGKTAHYMLRWVRSGDEKGPWSETISATITA